MADLTGPMCGSRGSRCRISYQMGAAGGKLVFSPIGEAGGQKEFHLWSSDGTAAGTQEIFSATHPWYPVDEVSLADSGHYRDRFVFSFQGTDGLEPWITDGTAQGTTMLGDFCPGDVNDSLGRPYPCSSWPRGFQEADGDLYFNAGKENEGKLYRLQAGAPAPVPVYEDPRLLGFRVSGDRIFLTMEESRAVSSAWVLDRNATAIAPQRLEICAAPGENPRWLNWMPTRFGLYAFSMNCQATGTRGRMGYQSFVTAL